MHDSGAMLVILHYDVPRCARLRFSKRSLSFKTVNVRYPNFRHREEIEALRPKLFPSSSGTLIKGS